MEKIRCCGRNGCRCSAAGAGLRTPHRGLEYYDGCQSSGHRGEKCRVGWQGNSRLADLCRQVYLQIPASGQVDWSGICGRRKDNLFGVADIDGRRLLAGWLEGDWRSGL